eukprot:scaffold3148_cov343-Prasinococcus_capsulatus_cf.AAC.1
MSAWTRTWLSRGQPALGPRTASIWPALRRCWRQADGSGDNVTPISARASQTPDPEWEGVRGDSDGSPAHWSRSSRRCGAWTEGISCLYNVRFSRPEDGHVHRMSTLGLPATARAIILRRLIPTHWSALTGLGSRRRNSSEDPCLLSPSAGASRGRRHLRAMRAGGRRGGVEGRHE